MESTNTESTRRVLLERLDTLLGREHRVEEHLRAPLAADSEEQALALEGAEVLVMSPQAPLAEALQRTPIGGTARFNGVAHKLVEVG